MVSRWPVSAAVSHLSDGLDGGSVLHQQLHHLHPVLLAGDVQGGEAVLQQEQTHTGRRDDRLV